MSITNQVSLYILYICQRAVPFSNHVALMILFYLSKDCVILQSCGTDNSALFNQGINILKEWYTTAVKLNPLILQGSTESNVDTGA